MNEVIIILPQEVDGRWRVHRARFSEHDYSDMEVRDFGLFFESYLHAVPFAEAMAAMYGLKILHR